VGLVRTILAAGVLTALGTVMPAHASVSYGYDALGRVTTALYDNGLCIVYAYDANGNRTSQTNTISSTPESPVWGTGTWGCFIWTPH
jgi:uncharacterized protein RhaS with RHS repeats